VVDVALRPAGPAPVSAGVTAVAPELLARLDRAGSLAGRPWTVTPLDGGLTNVNLRVETPDGRFVARLSGETGSLLAIDRDAEHRNSVAASSTGVAPEVVDYLPDAGVLVIRWVEGRTLTPAELADPATLARVAGSVRRLHAGPRFVSDFDMFEVQRRYLEIVRREGFRLPARYEELLPQADRIRQALAARPEPTVPCNNDLLAANFIDDGEQVWLIDYEYSGNNDPCFELGNIWSESTLPEELLPELVTAYYGRPRADRVARARLLGLMSKYGWTLWASIQDGASPLDFDFWSWGMEKYERAVEEFGSPRFVTWLEEAIAPA
jgi:thiamine kinase-like enzyme